MDERLFKIDIQLFATNEFTTEAPNNVLPATTQLKVAGTDTNIWNFLSKVSDGDLKSNSDSKKILEIYSGSENVGVLLFGEELQNGDTVNNDWTHIENWYEGEDTSQPYIIINISSWTIEERTISTVTQGAINAGFTWEDLDAEFDESRTINIKGNSGKIVFKQNSFIEFKAEPSEYATIVDSPSEPEEGEIYVDLDAASDIIINGLNLGQQYSDYIMIPNLYDGKITIVGNSSSSGHKIGNVRLTYSDESVQNSNFVEFYSCFTSPDTVIEFELQNGKTPLSIIETDIGWGTCPF